MQEEDRELLNEFVVESRELLEQVEPDLMSLDTSGGDNPGDVVNRIFRAVHSVKGAAGFFGLETIGKLSHAMESVLMKVRDGVLPPTPEMVNVLLDGNDRLRALVDDVYGSNDVDVEQMVASVLAFLERPVAAPEENGEAEPQDEPAAEEPPAREEPCEREQGKPQADKTAEGNAPEAQSLDELQKPSLEGWVTEFEGQFALDDELARLLRKNGARLYRVELVAADLAEQGRTVEEALGIMGSVGTALHCSLPQTEIERAADAAVHVASVLGPELAPEGFELRSDRIHEIQVPPSKESLAAKAAHAEEENQGGKGLGAGQEPEEADRTGCDFESSEKKPPATEPKAKEQKQAPPPSVPKEKRPASGAEPSRPLAQVDETVRVKTSVLNALMEMAGEMVLSRNRLVRVLERHVDSIEGLGPVLGQVSGITTDIQEQIMRTRLQPVGTLFGRFRRVVRDVSTKLGKNVELVTQGEDVELDKTIIEGLSDPLTHLIRNCLDHGLEMPEDREIIGKPPKGTVSITAYHEGGMVNIDVDDDGRGIDADRLIQKAVEKGLISDEHADRLTEREAMNLIFLPGFSTAREVTDVSGRGVGMDVVKTNIEKLGGTVDLSSERGRGTRVGLKLPLTLAIVSSLIVEVEKQRFALPQVGLEEAIRLHSAEDGQRIERIRGANVLRHRGKLLPIVSLSEVLGLQRTFVDPETKARKQDRRLRLADRRSRADDGVEDERRVRSDRRTSLANVQRILVLRNGRNRFGLLVDRIVDNEEIVVKPMSRFVRNTPCFSGNTILGDGTIAMILDTVGISAKSNLRFDELAEEEAVESHRSRSQGVQEKLQVLLFENGTEERFAVPLAQVARIEKISSSDIKKVGHGEYLNYRDSSLPLVRLHDHLPIQMPMEEPETLYVLIPKMVKRPLGIVTTSVFDAMDFSSEIDTETISATGVIGSKIVDGRIVLLLDIFSLFSLADPLQPEQALHEELEVLLAEDSRIHQIVLGHYLESAGARVTVVSTGDEALRSLIESSFDLVVGDLGLPLLDGTRLLEKLRGDSSFRKTPVIGLDSGWADSTRRTSDGGLDFVVAKLDRPAILEAIVRIRDAATEVA